MTPEIQKILWTREATTPEQIMMLKMLDIFGDNEIKGTLTEIAGYLDIKRSYLITQLQGLRDLGWIETERAYLKTDGNLPKVSGITIRMKIKED